MDDRERYFRWLCNMIETLSVTDDFMKCLFETQFVFNKSHDSNRAEDGLSLRERYDSETGSNMKSSKEPCSVLEMMIALAIRAEEILYDPTDGTHAPSIFWQMVGNMGIVDTTNDQFDYYDTMHKLHRMMGRRYLPNGKGGLFYISDCTEDLREVELWYQMLWYINKYY